MAMKYSPEQLPGELFYRGYLNESEAYFQIQYNHYQNWRMNLGLPMTDIDAVISDGHLESFNAMRNIEYMKIAGKCIPYAILEMKHFRTPDMVITTILDTSTPNGEVANLAGLPFFVVKYFPAQENNNRWEFSVYPVNDHAKQILKFSQHMSERRFTQFMYQDLRKQTVPENLLENTCQQKNSSLFSPL